MYWVQDSLGTMLPALIVAFWHLGMCTYPQILTVLPQVYIFFTSGTQTRIAVLIHSVTIMHEKITSETMRIIIWDVYSLLFSCPDRSCLFWGFINSRTQPVAGKAGDSFSQPFTYFSPFRSGMNILRMFSSLWMLKTPHFCF